ncbi:MAG: TetR/AcrR family transcriptional regulator [Rhodomicrobium sp.]
MTRTPKQSRSRARVERILDSAAALLADDEAEKITVRTLAARSGVSVGTIYQFFRDVEAVRGAVAERTYAGFRSALAAHLTEDAARASPGEFFCTLIDVIGALQKQYPQVGCLVRGDNSDELRAAFAAELKELIAAHVRSTFARAFPKMQKNERELKLEVAQSVMLGALQAMPSGPEASRLAHMTQTKAAVSLYANASFIPRGP